MASFNRYQSWSRNATPLSGGLDISTTSPCDLRLVANTMNDVINMDEAKRYPGLRIFVIEDQKEYWYKIPDSITGSASYADLTLVPYHPETAFVISNREQAPASAETGAEATVISNGNVTKLIYNGSEWVPLSGAGGGEGGDVTNNYSAIILNFTTADAASINGLTSEIITTAYQTQTETNTIPVGTEVTAVFSNDGVATARKYIWINGAWFITHGTQEYIVTLPAYNSWENEYSPTLDSNFTVSKTSVEGIVDLIITHQFDSQYIDAFVYARGTGDKDGDGNSDTYGERLLSTVTCLDSNNSGVFKVRLQIPVAKDTATTYAITLQK